MLVAGLAMGLAVLLFTAIPASASAGPIVTYPVSGGGQDIATGPDGALWFTGGSQVGRITTGGSSSTFDAGVPLTWGITAGPDGAMWIVGDDCGPSCTTKIVRMTTAGQVTDTFTVPTSSVVGREIVSGPDGALWFTAVSACCSPNSHDVIGRVTTSGQFTMRSLPSGQGLPNAGGLAVGPDGALWFTEGDAIGRITTGGTISSFSAPGADGDIAKGPDDALWYTAGNDALGRITTGGQTTVFPLTACSTPAALATGSDGNIWFIGNAIGRVTTSGTATEWDVPSGFEALTDITSGPDGNLWSPFFATTNQQQTSIAKIPTLPDAPSFGGACTPLPVGTFGIVGLAVLLGALFMGAQLRSRRRVFA